MLLDAVVDFDWRPVTIHVPAICLAEVQCVLDKYRYCGWNGPASKDRSKRLTKAEYVAASKRLAQIAGSRRVHRFDVSQDHLKMVSLVSVVNQKYKVRRWTQRSDRTSNNSRVVPPMGTADCIVAAHAIDIGSKVGVGSVAVITTDKRLRDVLNRCSSLTQRKAESLSMNQIAHIAGFDWSQSLYPKCVHIGEATVDELRDALGSWPLPSRLLSHRTVAELSKSDLKKLYDLGVRIKDQTGVGPDSLPYSKELDCLQNGYACDTGKYLLKADIAKRLLAWRKNPSTRP